MTADINPASAGDPTTAAGSELSIPKARFDEVNARLRQKEEELAIKDRLYLENLQRTRAEAQPLQARVMTPEESGLDPETHAKVMKMTQFAVEQAVSKEREMFGQQIGILSARTEKAELLSEKGADKAKHYPEIQRRQQAHYQRTNSFLPAEIALAMIESDEKDAKIRALEARIAGQPAPAGQSAAAAVAQGTSPAASASGPNAAGSRMMPGSGGSGAASAASAAKDFSELSVEEMEARLEEQTKAGARF